MSSDPKSPNGADQIEDLPASDSAEAMDADGVRGGYSLGASNPHSLPGVKASPTGDADYLPKGRLDPIPGLGRP